MDSMSQHATTAGPDGLSADDQAYLECEREHWGVGPRKEQFVFDQFGVSLPVFYQRLYRIAATEEAWKYDPVLIRHIQDTADDVTAKRLTRQGKNRG